MTASSPLHQPIVASRQSANARVQILQGFPFRRRPCRARGVNPSAGLMMCPVEIPLSVGVSPDTLRADLAGSARTFGSLINRICLRALNPINQTGV